MLDRIQEIFDHLIETWLKVAQYFDGLLSEHDNIFHPEAHSRLLSDDTTFSRSRRYTWAIDCVLAFDVSVTDAARQWEEWNKCWITPCLQNPEFEELEELRFKTVKVGQTVHRLERIRIQLQQSREHATASREGLFNASSVIEARAASLIGENVKLLTYLNIIYLPIMYSIAFFALTTDKYIDMRRLPWITVLISAVTYLAMLNVDHIARVLSWRPLLPQRYKLSVLEKMSRDPDRMWRERGALLNANNAATPAHADTSVSSWGLHEYFILNWWRERKERKRIERRDRPPLITDGGRRWQWARILKPRFLTGWVKTPHITPARNGTGAHRREEEEILGNTEGMEVDEISITRPEPAHVRNTY